MIINYQKEIQTKLRSGDWLSRRRSKLEMCVDILRMLEQSGPLKLTHIMYKANVNCSVLKKYLGSLIKKGLLEEKDIGKKRKVYKITARGKTITNYYKELNKGLFSIDELKFRQYPIEIS